jgi:hypothetical protein
VASEHDGGDADRHDRSRQNPDPQRGHVRISTAHPPGSVAGWHEVAGVALVVVPATAVVVPATAVVSTATAVVSTVAAVTHD